MQKSIIVLSFLYLGRQEPLIHFRVTVAYVYNAILRGWAHARLDLKPNTLMSTWNWIMMHNCKTGMMQNANANVLIIGWTQSCHGLGMRCWLGSTPTQFWVEERNRVSYAQKYDCAIQLRNVWGCSQVNISSQDRDVWELITFESLLRETLKVERFFNGY